MNPLAAGIEGGWIIPHNFEGSHYAEVWFRDGSKEVVRLDNLTMKDEALILGAYIAQFPPFVGQPTVRQLHPAQEVALDPEVV